MRLVVSLSLLLLPAACGRNVEGPKEPLPPNGELACMRAIECKTIPDDDLLRCVDCVDHVADKWNAAAVEYFGEGKVPAFKDVPCEWVAWLVEKSDLDACSAAGWYTRAGN